MPQPTVLKLYLLISDNQYIMYMYKGFGNQECVYVLPK